MSAEKILDHFREQAMYCTMFGSPFTGELVTRMADDLEIGGPVAALVGDWRGSPRADVVALRLCGALHAGVLMGARRRAHRFLSGCKRRMEHGQGLAGGARVSCARAGMGGGLPEVGPANQ